MRLGITHFDASHLIDFRKPSYISKKGSAPFFEIYVYDIFNSEPYIKTYEK